mmetsp:Transcript_60521/g.142856  ORF Transcript_60521/g.142856 Transcript_60521/m.142856 type:complete len:262 (-) Transcript_60521:120-905(-)|eukprot:CAMPEP_0177693366 /NCGR_PEP_ID=MMETSP0484_2-20121128/2361_1 /TAXON_ID=354590 /ORGANISM="Rhodomonas lens, Strain RHODO" /LENGTH=261 /DNA_ID=CAMNT_0019204171 /DNA_START=22 /DNA_END=807 /DNA_ORIENTATION=+
MADARHRVLEIKPCDEITAEALSAHIVPSMLPPDGNETAEKQYLKRQGFKDPRGLKCYSKDSTFPDIYAYFDFADQSSPVNIACTKAFKCYGLDGAQQIMNWDTIRGSCVVLREEPPISFTASSFGASQTEHNATAVQDFSISEMVDTLLFFQDKDARKIALKRDASRTMGSAPGGATPMGMPADFFTSGMYMGPAGERAMHKVGGKDAEECRVCGKISAMCGGLKHCAVCKAVKYCCAECQRLDWKRHKKESPACNTKAK